EALGRAFALGTPYQSFVALQAAGLEARLGETDAALDWIRRALRSGLEDRVDLQTMKAFAGLRDDPRFRALAGFPPDTSLDRDARWRYDLAYMVEEALRLHPSPRGGGLPPAFLDAATALEDSVPALSDAAILRGLQRVVARLGDGHSVVYGIREGEGASARSYLPVLFWQFDDGFFIVDADSAHRDLLGSRVVALGGLPPDTVLARLAPCVNHDNALTTRWLGVRFYMRSPGWLRDVGAAADSGGVQVALEDSGGARRSVTLVPTHQDLPRKLHWPWRHEGAGAAGRASDGTGRTSDASGSAGGHGRAPLWLQDPDTNYWMRWLPDPGILYVQFNQVRDEEDLPLSRFADRLRARIDSTGTRTVVVDVRRNNGGNNGLLEPLLRTLAWFDADRPGNRLFVLTSRNTFSAAQNFVNRVKWRTDATFVGEPSASRPNVVGEDTHVVLPYSRALLSISSRYWQDFDPRDDRPWISPDMPVGLTSEAFLAGRDPALKAVVQAVEGEGRPGG
ncbi:MAG TPA: hypothetical protein VKA44_09700, partial [Gemmatimonadota bacterium]|nr:hypothetical protein [Gemmatimonadota bacterium]